MPNLTAATSAPGRPAPIPAGRFLVVPSSPRQGVYRVEVTYRSPAGKLVDELSGSYESRSLASGIARVLAKALVADGSTVEAARAAVAGFLDDQLAMLTAAGGLDAVDAAAHLQRIKARFESADERAWSADIIRQINAVVDGRTAR